MIVTVNCPICKVMRIYTPPFGGRDETAPLVPNSVPERIVSCKGSFVKNCRLGCTAVCNWRGLPYYYIRLEIISVRRGEFRRLRAASDFPSDGKVTKGSPGDAADGHFVPIGPLTPGSPFTGVIPWSGQSISSAQNLSDILNSRRATGPWVSEN